MFPVFVTDKMEDLSIKFCPSIWIGIVWRLMSRFDPRKFL